VVLGHEPRHPASQGVHPGDAGDRFEVEHRSQVQTTRRGVAGEAGADTVSGDEALEVGDEVPQAVRSDGGVLDERRRPVGPGRAHEQGQHGATQRRRLAESLSVLEPHGPGGAERPGQPGEAAEPGARLLLTALILHREQRGLPALQQRRHARIPRQTRRPPQRLEVEELYRRRTGVEECHVGLQGPAQRVEGQRRSETPPGQRIEEHLELGGERQGPLGSREQPGEVGLRREQLTQVVARGAAPGLGRTVGDDAPGAPAYPGERRRERSARSAADPGRKVPAGAGAERDRLAGGQHPGEAQYLVLGLTVDDRA